MPFKHTDTELIVNLRLNNSLHNLAKELATRKRCYLSTIYEQALQELLMKPENYLGENYPVPALHHDGLRCTKVIGGRRCLLTFDHTCTHQVK